MKELSVIESTDIEERESELPTESTPYTENTILTEKKRSHSPFFIITAIFLAAVSVAIHLSALYSLYSYVTTEGATLFFSQLIPGYVISDPTLPVLPEGEAIENEPPKEDIRSPEKIQFITSDLSAKAENGMVITNETSYTPDLYQLLYEDRTQPSLANLNKKYKKSSPKVLIYHTHATESYADTKGTGFRSTDNSKNTVAVGKAICAVLKEAGIGVIHLTEQFDRDDWSTSYENSNKAVTETLKKYPSIKYVFDVHRDCIGNEEEGYIKAITDIEKKSCAQLMFVCGTDDGGSGHTSWRKNLSFALKLQSKLWQKHEGLVRPINLRKASFYQNSTPSSLIVECGTCACTISEAKRAGILFASALASYIAEKDDIVDEKALMQSLCP